MQATILNLVSISLALLSVVNAHTLLTTVNGAATGIRQVTDNGPLKDLTSPDMTCGKVKVKMPGVLSLKAGADVTVHYDHDGHEVIDPSHKGPCNVYLASTDGEGGAPTSKFSKIFGFGYGADKKSCVDNLIAAKGDLTFKLPSNLKSGNYILRSELLALHEAENVGGAQFYVTCIDIKVDGAANGVAPGTGANAVSIPGYLNSKSPGVLFNIYNGNPSDTTYPNPGPAVDSTFTGLTTGNGTGGRGSSAVGSGPSSGTVGSGPSSGTVGSGPSSGPVGSGPSSGPVGSGPSSGPVGSGPSSGPSSGTVGSGSGSGSGAGSGSHTGHGGKGHKGKCSHKHRTHSAQPGSSTSQPAY